MFPDLPRTSLDRTMEHHEQLPPYSNDGQLPAYITEKDLSDRQRQHSKAPSKMSTFKSILTGDVHKHNPRYTLEESVTGQRTVPRPTRSESSESKSKSSSQSRSPKLNPTLKSILTGDVHKHNPRYVLEESVTGQRSHARSTSPNPSDSKSKSSQTTLKSILTGDVHKYHPMYRLEESADASMRSRR